MANTYVKALLLLVVCAQMAYAQPSNAIVNSTTSPPLSPSAEIVHGGHLWWKLPMPNVEMVYGQITVLATTPGVYFCGANWNPGQPAGGYFGIQHIRPDIHRSIFSVWDTNTKDNLRSYLVTANSTTVANRFTGEGEGEQTYKIWDWKIGQPFSFFLYKQPGSLPDTTDVSCYFFDLKMRKWIFMAKIESPNAGHKTVPIFHSLISFLENFGAKDKGVLPKLALYRLWAGDTLQNLQFVQSCKGDRKNGWGQLKESYFLAEGQPEGLNEVFSQISQKYGTPIFPDDKNNIAPLSDHLLSPSVLRELSELLR